VKGTYIDIGHLLCYLDMFISLEPVSSFTDNDLSKKVGTGLGWTRRRQGVDLSWSSRRNLDAISTPLCLTGTSHSGDSMGDANLSGPAP